MTVEETKTPPNEATSAPPPPPPVTTPALGEKLKERAMVTTITLPSLGMPYVKDGVDRMPGGKVLISSMTASEEKIMANKGQIASDKTNILLTRACDLGSVAPDELILADRFYLLIKLRSISYGNVYGVQIVCEGCDTQFRHEVDLERDLQVKVADEEWAEPFTVTLPMTKRLLSLRLLRGSDERSIDQQIKRKHQKNIHEPGNPGYTLLLAKHITAIDGEDMRGPGALNFVEKMPVRDRTALTDAISANSPGIDPEMEFLCPNCGYTNEAVLPMSAEFFRPRRS